MVSGAGITLWYYQAYINTKYLKDLEVRGIIDYESMTNSRWSVPSFQLSPFMFEVEIGDPGTSRWNNVTYSINYYQMGTTDWFKANATTWGEWGYSFHHLTNGALDGSGVRHYGGFPTTPSSKQAAYEYMRNYVTNFTQYLNGNQRSWISFNGHYPYHHYAAEFGFDAIGTEIGENMESHQMLMAFNRGAARQYQLPWFVDVSAWYGSGITDSNDPPFWGTFSGENNGHSLSFYRRAYYMAYMAGASRVIAEAGGLNYFYHNSADPTTGLMTLTPMGEIGREFANFTTRHPDRGIAYNPIAIYLDQYHGTTGFAENKKAFNAIPYSKGDEMTYELLETLFPGGWIENGKEKCQLVNNEFGDIFDIILQNASADVLASYPVIFMSGEIKLGSEEAARLIDYVDNGGTLIVNTAYLTVLNQVFTARGTSFRLQYGWSDFIKTVRSDAQNSNRGSFILYGNDYDTTKIRTILREIVPKITPFTIRTTGPFGSDQGKWGANTHIQQLITRNANGWILTLINNDGITKTHHEPPKIEPRQEKTVSIALNPTFYSNQSEIPTISRITDWITDNILWEHDSNPQKNSEKNFNSLSVALKPGDLIVLEFQIM
jgi:hypothetical protein